MPNTKNVNTIFLSFVILFNTLIIIYKTVLLLIEYPIFIFNISYVRFKDTYERLIFFIIQYIFINIFSYDILIIFALFLNFSDIKFISGLYTIWFNGSIYV